WNIGSTDRKRVRLSWGRLNRGREWITNDPLAFRNTHNNGTSRNNHRGMGWLLSFSYLFHRSLFLFIFPTSLVHRLWQDRSIYCFPFRLCPFFWLPCWAWFNREAVAKGLRVCLRLFSRSCFRACEAACRSCLRCSS